jgi:hypothetical protein
MVPRWPLLEMHEKERTPPRFCVTFENLASRPPYLLESWG